MALPLIVGIAAAIAATSAGAAGAVRMKKDEKRKAAKKMLNLGDSVDKIATVTGLSRKEIENLRG